jgi:hypothetical protein
MAANQLQAMHAHVGFTNGAINDIFDVQSVDSVRELECLNNDNCINLCKTIRRPGGHLPSPAFVAGGAEQATIPCTGIMVSQQAETNMQLALCTVWHDASISCVTNIAGVNPALIRQLRELKIKEESRITDAPSLFRLLTTRTGQRQWIHSRKILVPS